jgi:hypothetical protein
MSVNHTNAAEGTEKGFGSIKGFGWKKMDPPALAVTSR